MLTLVFSVLAFISWTLVLLKEGTLIFWEADQGAVFFKLDSKTLNNRYMPTSDIHRIDKRYQRKLEEGRFMYLLQPFRQFFKAKNKIEDGIEKPNSSTRPCYNCGESSSDCVLEPCGHSGICQFCALELKQLKE